MRASRAEFEQRFWIFGGIFAVGFSLYVVDNTNSGIWLLQILAPHLDLKSPEANRLARLAFGAGALLVFLSAALRTWATAYLKTEVVHDRAQHAESVVADGPYRYTRNPLYLANLSLAAGVGTMASRAGWLFMVVAMWIYVYRLIGREEEMLLASQGESYHKFLGAVPRFWPSLGPRLPASGARPHWGQAFAGESLFWFFGFSVATFMLTFSFPIFRIVFALGFVCYFVSVRTITKRAQSSKN